MKTKTPRAPLHFSDKTRELWRLIHSEYELEPEAGELLRVALENLDLGDTARETLRKDGVVIKDDKGAMRKHPALDAAKLHDGMFCRALRQLGLDVIAAGPIGRPAGS